IRDGSRALVSKTPIAALLIFSIVFSTLALVQRKVQDGETKSELAAAAFPALVREYIDDLHGRHPMLAASSGIHTWDDLLEDFSPTALAAETAAIKHFQARLARVPKLELGLSDLFDYQILASNMSSRLLELEQVKTFERNPQMYNDWLSTALLQLVVFEYAPPEVRLRHLISKEKQVSRFLQDARANVRKPDATLLRIAIENFKGTLGFVQKDLPSAFKGVSDAGLKKEFAKSTREAQDALTRHIKLLSQIKPDA